MVLSPRHLTNAPILEGLVDVRVQARPDFQPGELDQLRASLREEFPTFIEKRGGQVTFEFGPEGPKTTKEDLGVQGLIFKSKDEKLLVQFRIDGFTINRLAPYTSWEDIYPRAQRLWKLYVDVSKPLLVTRIALRYINRFETLTSSGDFQRILPYAPAGPADVSHSVQEFVSRVTIKDSADGLHAHVVQVLRRSPGGSMELLLDIDAFKEVSLEPNDDEVENTWLKLRTFKNLLFFAYVSEITIKALE